MSRAAELRAAAERATRTNSISRPLTDAAQESSPQSMTDYRRGDLTQIRLPGLMLAEQRIRRSIRRIRDNMPAMNGHIRAELEEVLADLHIAIDAIQ